MAGKFWSSPSKGRSIVSGDLFFVLDELIASQECLEIAEEMLRCGLLSTYDQWHGWLDENMDAHVMATVRGSRDLKGPYTGGKTQSVGRACPSPHSHLPCIAQQCDEDGQCRRSGATRVLRLDTSQHK